MKKTKNEDTVGIIQVNVRSLVVGNEVMTSDGGFGRILAVDPVLDPRGGVYEAESDEVIVRLDKATLVSTVLMSGSVTVKAA